MADIEAENLESRSDAEGIDAPESEVLQELAPKEQPEVKNAEEPSKARGIDALMSVSMNVQVVLGRCRLPISELLELSRGSVIELDRRVGDAVDVLVNDRLVARGHLVKLENERVGVTLSEIVENHSGDS